jgi:hypothetical protein
MSWLVVRDGLVMEKWRSVLGRRRRQNDVVTDRVYLR